MSFMCSLQPSAVDRNRQILMNSGIDFPIPSKFASCFLKRTGQSSLLKGTVDTRLHPRYGVTRVEMSGAFCNRALAKRKLGRHQEALADWKKTVELDPHTNSAMQNLFQVGKVESSYPRASLGPASRVEPVESVGVRLRGERSPDGRQRVYSLRRHPER